MVYCYRLLRLKKRYRDTVETISLLMKQTVRQVYSFIAKLVLPCTVTICLISTLQCHTTGGGNVLLLCHYWNGSLSLSGLPSLLVWVQTREHAATVLLL